MLVVEMVPKILLGAFGSFEKLQLWVLVTAFCMHSVVLLLKKIRKRIVMKGGLNRVVTFLYNVSVWKV